MKSMQHTVVLGLSACALAVMNAASWGLPLHEGSATPMPLLQEPQQAPQTDQGRPDEAKATTFTGTVVKQGESYVLRDSSGAVYRLDNASRAAQFEGKSVTVTGKLDPQTKMIHVDSIEGA